MEATKLLADGK